MFSCNPLCRIGKRIEKAMGIRQSFDEIKKLHPDEWVLLNEPLLVASRFREGELVFHSPDIDFVEKRALELRLPCTAVLFTGPPIPAGCEAWLLPPHGWLETHKELL